MTDLASLHGGEWYADVPRSIGRQSAIGFGLILLVLGGFSTWAFTAPLAAAIVAPGSFVATGQNKIVQHLEGGVITEILVQEGDHVTAGQPLVTLDKTAARANERQLFLRRARLEAIVARLEAQVRSKQAITWPSVLADQSDREVADIRETQTMTFDSWTSKFDADIQLLKQNSVSLKFRSDGYGQQREAMQQQYQLLREEYQGKKTLLDQGLMRGTEVKALQRAMADAIGQEGRLMAEVADLKTQIVKTEQQVEQVRNTYIQAALDDLQRAQTELDSVREQSREAENVLRRSTIDAPVSGVVIRLYYHTSGGVIESGKAILEILPSDVPLIIETQVPRSQIDGVRVGEHATVRLVALNARTTPVLDGEVFYVSADSLPNQPNGPKEVYLARIRISPSELERVPGFHPTPGMPAEIMVQTAERTFFQYISKPVRDSMARSFLER